jgi:predicted adenylyl cyclase CyaB
MSTEIEVKFQLDDKQITCIQDNLSSLGFYLVEEFDQRDTYFIHSVISGLSSHPKTYLRVRTNDGVSSTAQHYKNEDYQWTELETVVENGDTLRQIYQNLGMPVDLEVHKLRKVYVSETLTTTEIVVDRLVGVGVFLEIESDSLETIWELANNLGLTKEQADKIKDKSYADLVREHNNTKV